MRDERKPMFTAKCRMEQEADGYRFTFFCAICGGGYTTPLIAASHQSVALRLGEQNARVHFNRCQRCHEWVCDEHFNENCMMCTVCAPRTCRVCAASVPKGDQFCSVCGEPQFETSKEGMD